jgi:3'-phosphoadenosine 5'-phosphosulfate (PAPS) 3'-phosphatase
MSDYVVGLMQRAVRRAAIKMVETLQNPAEMEARRKSDRSWVLSVDLEAHEHICEELGTDLPIVSEEDAKTHGLGTEQDTFFLVDPLDGTSACLRFRGESGGQIGYGPLIGYVEQGVIEASVYVHIPRRLVFTARKGKGLYVSPLADSAEVKKIPCRSMTERKQSDCVVLFHMGSELESRLIFRLKDDAILDNAFRFGGFANDSCRLALGYEEVQLQLSVSPWDLPATLIPKEAGFDVIVDPVNSATPLEDWKLRENNPVLVCPSHLTTPLIDSVRQLIKEL